MQICTTATIGEVQPMRPSIDEQARELGLNQFTGCSDKTLKVRLKNMLADLKARQESDEEHGGGSPFEGILERIDELETELKRRACL